MPDYKLFQEIQEVARFRHRVPGCFSRKIKLITPPQLTPLTLTVRIPEFLI